MSTMSEWNTSSNVHLESVSNVTITTLDVLLLPFLNESNNGSSVFDPDQNEDYLQESNSSIELSVLRLQGAKKYILEGCLLISSISLIASFLVYCIVPELRTVPGKCLMGLIVSELTTDLFVIAALHYTPRPYSLSCFIIGICIHYFFLTIVCWTSVIAFDIFKKFKYPNQKLRHFVRYIFYVYLIPLVVVSIALTVEFSPRTAGSLFRPRYGQRICGISAPMAKLVFLTVPINISLIVNIVIFLIAIYKIKKVVNEISHSSISSSIRERCLWYAKLSLLLGISSMFGYFGIQLPCCQSLKFATFLINAMHGSFIFIAFTCKRSTFRLLAKHILACRPIKSSTKAAADGSKKSTKFTLDENGVDSRESSLRMGSKEMYRGRHIGQTFATTTTITSSSENTPNRNHPLALHSIGHNQLAESGSYPKFDTIVICHDCNNNGNSQQPNKPPVSPT